MSLVFFGTPEFAVPSLTALLDSGEEVALAVTRPDRRKGRDSKPSPPPVKTEAVRRAVPVMQPSHLTDPSFLHTLTGLAPEFITVVAYGKILPPDILRIPSRGCVNVHASLLPKYRGAAPVQWALLRGETVTGVTTMLMDSGLDTGDILLQSRMEIRDEDNGETLARSLSVAGARLLLQTLRGVRDGSVVPSPQSGTPTFAPPLRKEDGRIDWSKTAGELFHFVRGMYPWPCAVSSIRGRNIRILETNAFPGTAEPGVIEEIAPDSLRVGTGKGLLGIRKLQPEGKRPMDAPSFARGNRVRRGDRFD